MDRQSLRAEAGSDDPQAELFFDLDFKNAAGATFHIRMTSSFLEAQSTRSTAGR